MDELLSTIDSPRDLQGCRTTQLEQLAGEMREALCRLVERRGPPISPRTWAWSS